MSPEAPKRVVRAYFEAIERGDEAALDTLLAPDYVQHVEGIPPGAEMVKRLLASFRAAFPDIHYGLEALLADGDLVVARTATEGTHRGVFMGHAPTGRRFRAGGIDIFRVRDGRLAERWGEFDTLGMLRQLGLYRPSSQGQGE